jgi:hypothetical protein
MKGGAGAALATLLALSLVSHSPRSFTSQPFSLLSKPHPKAQGPSEAIKHFVHKTEGEIKRLQASMPRGVVRASFPKEEKEVSSDFKASEASIDKLLKVQQKKTSAKKALMQNLAQIPSPRSNLKKLVNEAGYVAAKLRSQIPAADMAMFPKEAKEFREAMAKDEASLAAIDSQLKNSKKAKISKLHQPSLAAQQLQKKLDSDTALDREENKALSSNEDVDSVLGAINDVYHSAQTKSKKAQMLAAKKAQAKGQKLSKAKAKGHKAYHPRSKTGMISSGAQTWGTIYEPQMAWGQQHGGLIGPAKKEFSHWASEAIKLTNVHDPAKDGHAEGQDAEHWWANKATDHDKWWTHDHTGRGY